METRVATLEDYPLFAHLFPELGLPDPTPSEAQFARMAPNVIVVYDGAHAIGYAYWQQYGVSAHLVQVVTAPSARRRGAGRTLVEAVRSRARAAGCSDWYLYVLRENARAQTMYSQAGLRSASGAWSRRVRLRWEQLRTISGATGAVAGVAAAGDDAALAAQFARSVEWIAAQRARPSVVIVTLRHLEDFVGFAVFDREGPLVRPFCVVQPVWLHALLEALLPYADRAHLHHVELVIDGDVALGEALAAAGATVCFEVLKMSAPLDGCSV